jgi:hypothetical protein
VIEKLSGWPQDLENLEIREMSGKKIGQGSHGIAREFRHWSGKYLMKPFI